MMLRNAVVRFADPATATTAAQGMHDRSLHMPRDPAPPPSSPHLNKPSPSPVTPRPPGRC
ncbi:hypothetical protein BZL29_7986 [Mycobacterium kansasii]|uniref:DUF7373 domain-containing protein n=1 Tax=Mycobacterium kansasii TaxID=1768 RepID=A0A1V3WE01_MYCKA|nr:hypothetical protein BZL29_7986 [Mycobacterium kansasii]